MDYDVDLFAPSLDRALEVVQALRGSLGLALSRCKVSSVEGDGLAVFNTFRESDGGHEIHVDVMAGGYLARGGVRPVWFRAPLWERSSVVSWMGASLRVPSPEDMLLMTAVRMVRKGEIVQRDLNDARFLLERGTDLDWTYIRSVAEGHQLNGALHFVATKAEEEAGRRLVPPGARRALSPGRLGRRLLAEAVASSGRQQKVRTSSGTAVRAGRRRWWKVWPALWQMRYAAARLGPARAIAYLATDRVQRRFLHWQMVLSRVDRRGLVPVVRLLGALRPRFGSLCELRGQPFPRELGFCVSQTAAARPEVIDRFPALAQDRLRAVVETLPERAYRERIATTEGDSQRWEAHRCGAFVFNLGRIHRAR
jgi:hypothetical protein